MASKTSGQYYRDVTTTFPVVGAMTEKLERLHRQARQCRELADCATTEEVRDILRDMAQDYEGRVAALQINGWEFSPIGRASD